MMAKRVHDDKIDTVTDNDGDDSHHDNIIATTSDTIDDSNNNNDKTTIITMTTIMIIHMFFFRHDRYFDYSNCSNISHCYNSHWGDLCVKYYKVCE